MRKQFNQIVSEATNIPTIDVIGPQVESVKKRIRRAMFPPIAYLLFLVTTMALEAIYVWPTISARITH